MTQPLVPGENEQNGKVYLVGSGPGDANYLTVQAQAVLKQAEVLVYDALVDGDLLDLVPDACLKLDVGKRGGQPSTPQPEINRLLVEHCQQGKLVVRLKNGDPFVFGRAEAEIKALRKADCDYEVMPGLSSALVAPLLAGIPVTDPMLSSCFTVLTAHNPDALNWVALARMDTLVILMGGRTLPDIVRRLRGHGRSPDTAIAIIRYAGRPQQQIWEGTLTDILTKTTNQSLSPCVIVIGEVVRLRPYLQGRRQKTEGGKQESGLWHQPSVERNRSQGFNVGPQPDEAEVSQWESEGIQNLPPSSSTAPSSPTAPSAPVSPSQTIPHSPLSTPQSLDPTPVMPSPDPPLPLSHKTILVTRAASQAGQFTRSLEELGATVIEMPTLEIGPPSSWRELDEAIAHLDDFDWLILTSTNGVDFFFDRLKVQQNGDAGFYSNIKIAVVGEKTAQRLERLELQPDFIPPNFVADSLVQHFPEPLPGLRILFPRVESGGREVLVKEFSSQGAKVREVAAYESRCPATIAPKALEALQNQTIDIITFASSKTVQNFCHLLQEANLEDAPPKDRNLKDPHLKGGDTSWQSLLKSVCIASIGPQTSKTCETLLDRVDVEAQEYTLDGLVQAILQWVESLGRSPQSLNIPNTNNANQEQT
jgi:uroporphyrinogen III methyltransferase/synthase